MSDIILLCSTCKTTCSTEHRDSVLWERIAGMLLCPRCSYSLDKAVRSHPSGKSQKKIEKPLDKRDTRRLELET